MAHRVAKRFRSRHERAALLLSWSMVALLICASLGCGGSDGQDNMGELDIVIESPGGPDQSYTLSCRTTEETMVGAGSLPEATETCKQLSEADDWPFPAVDRFGGECDISGGDETATVSGTWEGRSFSMMYRLNGGNYMSQWAAQPVLANVPPSVDMVPC